jgi:XTP/dITP diphosphohydrolase
MPAILLATRNPGKLRELRELTADTPLHCICLADLPDLPPAPEPASSFQENARAKALYYAQATRRYCLADDSGLCVDCLGGAPGVHSAHYAGLPPDDAANNRKLLAALVGIPLQRRTARFFCAMAFARPGQVLCESSGTVEGLIIDQPRGDNGFGYDPLFLIPHLGRTIAELHPKEKNALSHRGKALRAILPQILQWFRLNLPQNLL